MQKFSQALIRNGIPPACPENELAYAQNCYNQSFCSKVKQTLTSLSHTLCAQHCQGGAGNPAIPNHYAKSLRSSTNTKKPCMIKQHHLKSII